MRNPFLLHDPNRRYKVLKPNTFVVWHAACIWCQFGFPATRREVGNVCRGPGDKPRGYGHLQVEVVGSVWKRGTGRGW